MRRCRPEGHKGPMRTWLEIDNWWVRIRLTGRDRHWSARKKLDRQAEELRAAYHRQSSAGQRERDFRWKLYWNACDDKAFQAFKAIFIPGRKKPGRRKAVQP